MPIIITIPMITKILKFSPVRASAQTVPIRASGIVTRMIPVCRNDSSRAASVSTTNRMDNTPASASPSCASAIISYIPENSYRYPGGRPTCPSTPALIWLTAVPSGRRLSSNWA